MTLKDQLALATKLAKEGAGRLKIMKETGLNREQTEEIKKRVKP